jgi:uncharacterized protein (DUF302 family)
MNPEGMTILSSPHGAKETMDRLVVAVAAAGMTVFARIDHAAGAEAVGLSMPPMEVLAFGSPRAGTPLMRAAATAGIDLPLKALVWQDEGGHVWLGYNQPAWIARRHGAMGVEPVVNAMTEAIAKVAEAAVA